jgi:GNAT superfamily N-acetyltransferase
VDDADLLPECLRGDVEEGLYFLATRADEPVGTMRRQPSDPEIWPDAPPGESLFVHRLAVRRHAAGAGVSLALLSFAIERARSIGRRYVRLDCEASRPRLRAVYEQFGFRHHSERRVGPCLVARYEFRVSPGQQRQAAP